MGLRLGVGAGVGVRVVARACSSMCLKTFFSLSALFFALPISSMRVRSRTLRASRA